MRRTEYYVQAFKRLEEHKHTFNWPAALFGPCWMSYRKMYLYAFLFGVIFCLTYIFIDCVWKVINECFNLNFSTQSSSVFSIILYYITACPLFGRFGNAFYSKIVKQRISKGYHLINKYSSTSILSGLLSGQYFFLCAAFADWILHKRYFKNKNRALNEADATYSEKNIRRYLDKKAINWLAIAIWSVLFIVAVLCYILAVV